MQVAYFDVGKHSSTPAQEFGDTRNFVLSFVRETTSGYQSETRPVLKSFPNTRIKLEAPWPESRSRRRFYGIVSTRPAWERDVEDA